MTPLFGNKAAHAAFEAAMRSGVLHHAWLFSGPQGVGKARFARIVALRLLAEAGASGAALPAGFDVPDGHPIRSLFNAGTHPDFRVMARLPKDPEKPDQDISRSITIAQVRALQPLFATTPSLGPRRVVLIDAIDDLERGGANALLKNLEEPPAGTIFLLISHAPGRLLPTIRSRCRQLRFEALRDEDVADAIRAHSPDADGEEVAALVRAGDGAPGRALRFAGLDIPGMDQAIERIAATGDPGNADRVKLARALSAKTAHPRYEAFLERAPSFIAHAARSRHGAALKTALDAQTEARYLAGAALGLSLDAQGTVFEMAGIIARLASASPR